MLLIVNADDLGASRVINDAIFAAMERGLVTSATLMANAPEVEEAARAAERFPQCSFGVHLNLTIYPPLAPSAGLKPLLVDGQLSSWIRTHRPGSETLAAIERELTAQVQRVLDLGVRVSHLDSHQHVHTRSFLFPVLKRLQRRFGIRRVRPAITLLPAGEKTTLGRSLRKALFRGALAHWYRTRYPEGLGDFRDFHPLLEAGRLPAYASLELMVHPGADGARYVQEMKLLEGGWRARLPATARLGSYFDL